MLSLRQVGDRNRLSIALILLAAALPAAMRAYLGPPGAIVHVRWRDDVTAAARADLERRFRLTEGADIGERTRRYDLADTTEGNIRAIVQHPAIEDTHHIDRPRSSLASTATRTSRLQRFPVYGDLIMRLGDLAAIALAAVAMVLVARSPAMTPVRQRFAALVRPLSPVLSLAAASLRLLSRGIPAVTPATAGAFRIIFGAAAVWFFASHPESAATLDRVNPLIEGDLHAAVLDWMRERPGIVDALAPWLLVTGVAFTAGLFTRLSYLLFVAGAIAWLFVANTHDSTHPNSTLGLTLVALLPSAWGDGLSIDRWLRRRRGSSPVAASRRYGYSVWVPGLVFGVAFASAAWAKLSGPPGWSDWILNGSVKYHFITDAHNAPLDWGLRVAGHPSLAVLASFFAVAVEALVVTAAFSRSEWYRLLMGAAALGLLSGFRLFMGVFWPAWWILLLGFLPWQRLSRVSPPITAPVSTVTAPTWAQAAMLVAVIAQQVTIATLRIERSPMFTYFPMYSSTYASGAAFNAALSPQYRMVVSTDGRDVRLPCEVTETVVDDFREALQGSGGAAARVWRVVLACSRDVDAPRRVMLEGDRRVFDWQAMKFETTPAAVVLGPLVAEAVPAESTRN